MHVSSAAGVAAIAQARSRRVPVFGEVLHNYLAFTSEDYAKPDGTLYHNYPPLKSPADQDALWSAIDVGDLDTVASDDFTIPRESKLSGQVVDNVPGGHNGIETRMDVLFSEGVSKNRLTVEQFVELTAEAPARLPRPPAGGYEPSPRRGCVPRRPVRRDQRGGAAHGRLRRHTGCGGRPAGGRARPHRHRQPARAADR